jgi:hypothetical protein
MSLLKHIYGVIFRPSQSFRILTDNYSSAILYQAILVYILVNIIGQGLSLGRLFASLFNCFFFASLIFLVAYIFILERKDYGKILSVIAFANVPLIFVAPVEIFVSTNASLGVLLHLLLGLWIFNLKILGLSSTLKISKRKIFLLYLLLPLALLGIGFMMIVQLMI